MKPNTKKRTFFLNRPKTPETEIEAYKNFESLLRNYATHKTQLKKLNIRNIVIAAFAGVALIILLLFLYYSIPVK